MSSTHRPMWAQYGRGGSSVALACDENLRQTRTLSAQVGATTRTALLHARKESMQATLNSRFGGNMADPHSFGSASTANVAPFSNTWAGATQCKPFKESDGDTTSLPTGESTCHTLRSELLHFRKQDRSTEAKARLGMPACYHMDISTRAARASKTLSQRKRQVRQEQRTAAQSAAPLHSLGVHARQLPKFASNPQRPWHAVRDEDIRCTVKRPFATADSQVTNSIAAKVASLASTRSTQSMTPISKATTSLVRLKETASKYKLPENPAKIDHFDMSDAGNRTYKLEYTTKKRWTSALIDHIKLTEESSSRSESIKRPKGLINPRELAPLYSSFTVDSIFRERHHKGTNLRADADIEETPVGESTRRERRQGQIYGEFAPLANDEERMQSIDHAKAGRERRLQMQDHTVVQMPLTPATLRLASRKNSSDAFEEFANSSVFGDGRVVEHFASGRFSNVKSAPQMSSRRLKPTAQHRFSSSNRFRVRSGGLS